MSRTADLRKRLSETLITDADFDAFCYDYFPDIYKDFSGGMKRTAKTTELLARVEAKDIEAYLDKTAAFAKSATRPSGLPPLTPALGSTPRTSFAWNKVLWGLGVLAALTGPAAWLSRGKPDYANMVSRRRGPCGAQKLQFIQDERNIIGSEIYAKKNMEPDPYYAEDSDKAIIQHEQAEGPTFYRIRTTKNGFINKGGNYGGFIYLLDKARLPINKKYRMSFCAWSTASGGLGLRIHHGTGNGSVSSLTRIAILTDKHDRFEWEVPLEWVGDVKNAPRQYLFGYIVDPVTGDGYDLNASARFSQQEFVIGDIRLEEVP